jgi:hypothetical protein
MGSPDYERSTTATTLAGLFSRLTRVADPDIEHLTALVIGRVRVRVSRACRRLLHGLRRVRAKQTITANDATGRSTTTVTVVTIRRIRGDGA